MSKISRRKLLKVLGSAGVFSVVEHNSFLGKTIIDSLFNSVNAQEGGLKPRNLISFIFGEGAASYYYYTPLNPNLEDLELYNENYQIFNHIKTIKPGPGGIPYYETSYESVPITANGRTLYWPKIFSYNVPAPGGGERSISTLAKEMMSIRGIQYRGAGHSDAPEWFAPIPGAPSITGIAADDSHTPIPYLSIGRDKNYKAPKGTGRTQISGDNDLANSLFTAFEEQTGNSAWSNIERSTKVLAGIDALSRDGQGKIQGDAKKLKTARDAAIKLLLKGVKALDTEYKALKTKYDDLIDRCIDSPILEGLTDRPLPGVPAEFSAKYTEKRSLTGAYYPGVYDGPKNLDYGVAELSFFRCASGDIMGLYAGSDMRSMFTKEISVDYKRNMGSKFAMVELLSTKRLCSNINVLMSGYAIRELPVDKWTNFTTLKTSYDENTNETTIETTGDNTKAISSLLHFDCHGTGALKKALGFTIYFRTFSACLLELREQLKNTTYDDGTNAWDETIVALGSEFSRKPTMSGDVHDNHASSCAFLGGTVKMSVLGNIYDIHQVNHNLEHFKYMGTNGQGAPLDSNDPDLNNREIISGNIHSTIAALCRLSTSPAPNNKPLAYVNELEKKTIDAIPQGKTKFRNRG